MYAFSLAVYFFNIVVLKYHGYQFVYWLFWRQISLKILKFLQISLQCCSIYSYLHQSKSNLLGGNLTDLTDSKVEYIIINYKILVMITSKVARVTCMLYLTICTNLVSEFDYYYFCIHEYAFGFGRSVYLLQITVLEYYLYQVAIIKLCFMHWVLCFSAVNVGASAYLSVSLVTILQKIFITTYISGSQICLVWSAQI